jgi:hypothetical protein
MNTRTETFNQMRERISKPFRSPNLSVRDKNSLDFRWKTKDGTFIGLKNLDTNHLKSIMKVIESSPDNTFAGKKKADWFLAISYEMQYRNSSGNLLVNMIPKLGKEIRKQI